jgi:hypothetical protein
VHDRTGEAGHAPVMAYRYRQEVLEQLLVHGVRPTSDTRPELVYEFLNDLYRYELRRLRHSLVTGTIPKVGYYDRVVELRRKYPLVSIKPHLWIENGPWRRGDTEVGN